MALLAFFCGLFELAHLSAAESGKAPLVGKEEEVLATSATCRANVAEVAKTSSSFLRWSVPKLEERLPMQSTRHGSASHDPNLAHQRMKAYINIVDRSSLKCQIVLFAATVNGSLGMLRV